MPSPTDARSVRSPASTGTLLVHLPPASCAGSAADDEVRVSGELDAASAPVLGSHLDALLQDGRAHLTLVLSDMTFCDVAGLHVLLRAGRALRARGGRLTVRRPCRTLLLMLDLLGPERTSIEVVGAAPS